MAVQRKTKKVGKKRKQNTKRPSRPRQRTAVKTVETALRHEDWCAKRIAGWSLTDIANWADVTPGGVRNAIVRRTSMAGLDDAREILRLDLARYEKIIKELWPKNRTQWNDFERVNTVLKALQQKTRLLQPVLPDVDISDEERQNPFDIMFSSEFKKWIKDRDNGVLLPGVIDVKAIVKPGKNGR